MVPHHVILASVIISYDKPLVCYALPSVTLLCRKLHVHVSQKEKPSSLSLPDFIYVHVSRKPFPPPPSLHDVIYDEPLARSSFLTALLVVSCSFRFSSRISSIFSSSSVIRAALCSTYEKQDRFEICFKFYAMDGWMVDR